MNKLRVLMILNLVLFLGCSAAFSITLDESLTEIFKTNPSVLEKIKDYNSAVQDRNRFESNYNPTVDLNAEAGQEEISNSSTRYNGKDSWVKGARITMKQLLYDGKRTRNDLNIRNVIAKSYLYKYFDAVNKIGYESIESYMNVIKYMRLMNIAEDNVEIHRKILASVKARFQAGSGGKSELERVQGRLAAAQSKLINYQNEYKKSVYRFHKYMGRYVDGKEMELPQFDNSLLPATLKEAFNTQMKNHPLLISADYNIRVKKWEVRREISDYKPVVNLEASRDWRKDYSGIRGFENDTRFMVNMRYNLYDGGVKKAKIGKAKSIVNKEKETKDRVKRSILNDLQLSWTSYKLLSSQIGAVRKSMFFTKAALKSYKEEFKVGKRNLINILDAENEYQSTRILLAKTKIDYLVAKYKILSSMGILAKCLKLDIPYGDKLNELRRPTVSQRDKLPLDLDVDKDGIKDIDDVSTNSIAGEKVDIVGGNSKKTKKYLDEPLNSSKSSKDVRIRRRRDLRVKRIKPDVKTTIDMVSFNKNSIELTTSSKLIMREVVEQIKDLSLDGLIQIYIHSTDKKSRIENYKLSMRRGYNIKKIFTIHNIEPDSIQVFAEDKSEVGKKNSISFKVVTKSDEFKKDYDPILLRKVKFRNKSTKFIKGALKVLKKFVSNIKIIKNPAIDVIVYSNDYDNASKNRNLARRRAKKIVSELSKMGIRSDKLAPIAWGSYNGELDLYENTEEVKLKNKVEFVIRN